MLMGRGRLAIECPVTHAPVRVLRPVTTTADHEEATVKVNVLPLQGEHFPLAQPEGEGNGPACGVRCHSAVGLSLEQTFPQG